MKTINRTLAILICSLTIVPFTYGQDPDKKHFMVIREDVVIPSLTNDYERALMDLKEFLTEKNVEGFNYFTHLRDDYVYTHVVPVSRIEDLSMGLHSYVQEKVDAPELDLILDYMKSYTNANRYYITKYRPELSYIPGEFEWSDKHKYRKWSYYHFQPGTENEVENVLLAWKKLYERKNVKMGFRIFSGFIGINQSIYILTTWAEDPQDYHNNLQKASELLGDDGASMWDKMINDLQEAEVVEGWFLPQYSYTKGMTLAN